MKKILVTGANGQLGQCIKDASLAHPDLDFTFATRKELSIENNQAVLEYFRKNNFDYCINTAAYTNVEKAESESDAAFATNAEAVKNLATVCKENNVVLLHVSTDYVFDGKKGTPYLETDATNPINVYGASKLKGEEYIEEIGGNYFIFRTSWLYSQYGHNFLNTILKYAKEGKALTITTEQTGTPTNANDLASLLLEVIVSNSEAYGLYHFSNKGEATWFDFAQVILESSNQLETTNLAKTDHYPTFAARPVYSLLDISKAQLVFKIKPLDWKVSLSIILKNSFNHKGI